MNKRSIIQHSPPAFRTCDDCKRTLELGKLNLEAKIHHNAKKLICLDRKSCERAKRKIKC